MTRMRGCLTNKVGSVFKVDETTVLMPVSESDESLVISVRFDTCKGGVVMLVWKCCVLC